MQLKQVKTSSAFETGDLVNKTWEQIIDEVIQDFKDEKLKELKDYKVPDNLIANVSLNFIIA